MKDLIFYYPIGHQEHQHPGHPERPERVEVIKQGLEVSGWWNEATLANPVPIPENVLYKIHGQAYLNNLRNMCANRQWLDQDTYTTPVSYKIAYNCAGGSIAVAESIWNGDIKRGFALNRPPGHHACFSRGMGFCLLNHIAITAEYLIQECNAKRLAIIDLDLHHGNGTQEIFWNRGDVFYISIHQLPLFPQSGYIDEIGENEGYKKTANFPLPPGSGDQAYQYIMDEFILYLLDMYLPEMILVSFGSDPHWLDPLGHLRLSAFVYSKLIRQLTNWVDEKAQGKIAIFLEGGYDLDAAVVCSRAIITGLLKEEFKDPLGLSPYVEGSSWKQMVEKAKNIWKY